MNPTSGGAGDLTITVGGDLTPLQAAFDAIPGVAQAAFAQVAAAIQDIDWSDLEQGVTAAAEGFQALGDAADAVTPALDGTAQAVQDIDWSDLEQGATGAAGSLNAVGEAADGVDGAVDATADSMAGLASATSQAGQAATQAAPPIESMIPAAGGLSDSANDAATGMMSMYGAFAALRIAEQIETDILSFAEAVLTAYGDIQEATISLAALTGSAQTANTEIAGLESLATSDALSFPSLVAADQKMTALGFSAQQITEALQTAADTAAATGNSFDTVTAAIDRMALSGTAGARQLATLGISTTALGQVMGVASTEVAAAFKALDQTQRLTDLESALSKFQGVAQQTAQSLLGAWQNLQTQFTIAAEAIGQAIAPVIQDLAELGSTVVVPAIKGLVDIFEALPAPIQNLAVLVGVLTLALIALAIPVAALAISFQFASAGMAQFGTIMGGLQIESVTGGLGGLAVQAANVATGAAVATTSMGVLGAALIQVGGILVAWIAGYNLGEWAYNQVPGMKALGDSTADLLLSIPGVQALINFLEGVTAAQTQLQQAADQLNAKLQAQGIFIDQGSASLEDWTHEMTAAAVAATFGATNLSQFNQSVSAAASAQNTLISNLQSAQKNLANVTTEFNTGFASAGQYNAAVAEVTKAFTALNGAGVTVATTLDQVLIGFRNAQANAATAAQSFGNVSAAFNAGQATAAQYTAALTALNKAQEDANNGFQTASTAAALAANAYRTLTVSATNAQTNLSAIATDVANGTATWGQYDAALKQLNTDQEAANNGFQNAHTALLIAQEDFQELGVSVANAYTQFEAVAYAYEIGETGAVQYTAALNALNSAQKALNDGYEDSHTALLIAQNDFANLKTAAANAATVLAATQQAYASNTAGLNQLIAALQGYAKAQDAASGGVVGYAAAVASITAAQDQLKLNLANANTELAAANNLYGQGAITAGVYQTYVAAASKAQQALKGTQDALTTSQQSGAAALKNLSAAQQSTNAVMQDAVNASTMSTTAYYANVTAIAGISNAHEQLQLNLQNSTQYLEAVTAAVNNGTASGGQLAAALQKVSQAEQALTGSAAPAASALQGLDSSLVQTATDAQQAAAGLTGIGTAAEAAGQAVQSLGQELDQTMNASIGNAQFSLSSGQTYTQPSPGTYIGGTEALGQQDPTEIANQTYGFGETNTFDPASIAAAALAATNAANTTSAAVTTAATTVTTATAAMTAALQQVTDANQLEQQAAAASGTAAYTALKQVADAASTAAAAALAAADGITQVAAAAQIDLTVTAAAATSTAGLSSAALNAGNAVAGLTSATTAAAATLATATTATADLTGVLSDGAEATQTALMSLTTASEAAAAAELAAAKTPVIGTPGSSFAAQPTGIGYGSGIGGTANGTLLTDTSVPLIGGTPGAGVGNGTTPPTAQPTSLIVNLTNTGTVVGANGMQQFSTMVANQIAQNLGSIGIRLNRQ